MKSLISLAILATILLFGCVDDSSDLIAPDSQITQKSTSPNWVKLPGDKGKDFSVGSKFSAQELINGEDGGVINLNFKIKRPGHKFGDFEINTSVQVEEHSFSDNEERLFTITLNPNNAYINITPSPNTLDKHIKVDWEIKGFDVSNINPNTFNFIYVGDGNEMLETSKDELTVDYKKHKIEVKKAIIDPTANGDTPDGAWYGFTL